jgi:hypothetical protein
LTISFYVKMPGVPGAAVRIMNLPAVVACSGQIGEFGAMDNDQVNYRSRPAFQARHIRQMVLNDPRVVHHAPALSGIACRAGTDRIAMLEMNEAVGV